MEKMFIFTDIDECTTGDPKCTAESHTEECINFDGGYNCTCREGYEQQADGQTCAGEKSAFIWNSSKKASTDIICAKEK